MTEAKPVRLIDDSRLVDYSIGDAGCTVLVSGESGAGKTLSLRNLIKMLGRDNVLILATDPRLAPLDGLNPRVLPCWITPGSEGAVLKQSAQDAHDRIMAFSKDLALAAGNPKIVVPKALVFDGISNYGDIQQARLCPPGGNLSEPQWGHVGKGMLDFIGFIRGLQIRGLFRVFTCTTGPMRGDKGQILTDPLGRPRQKFMVGTGGRMAPDHMHRFIDYHLHVDAYFDKTNPEAGPDGMVRRFQTCTADGVMAKGAPQFPTPFMKADMWEVYRLINGLPATGAGSQS